MKKVKVMSSSDLESYDENLDFGQSEEKVSLIRTGSKDDKTC